MATELIGFTPIPAEERALEFGKVVHGYLAPQVLAEGFGCRMIIFLPSRHSPALLTGEKALFETKNFVERRRAGVVLDIFPQDLDCEIPATFVQDLSELAQLYGADNMVIKEHDLEGGLTVFNEFRSHGWACPIPGAIMASVWKF